jgi:hypothetical protein
MLVVDRLLRFTELIRNTSFIYTSKSVSFGKEAFSQFFQISQHVNALVVAGKRLRKPSFSAFFLRYLLRKK